MASSPDILVLGSGLIGLACARELRRHGARVELWERLPAEAAPGAEPGGPADDSVASTASAGMLAPLAEVPDEPAFFEICRNARDAWTRWAPELASETGISLDYDRSGALIVDQDGWVDQLRAAAERHAEPYQELDYDDARERVPDLPAKIEDPAVDPPRTLLLPGEHRVDNRQVCRALRRALEDSGAVIRYGLRARSIEAGPRGVRSTGMEGGKSVSVEAGQVLVTAGAWSADIAGLPTLPVVPVRGQMLRLEGVDWPFRGSVRGRHHYAVRRRGDRLLVGATVEQVGFDPRVTPGGLGELSDFLNRFLPGAAARPLGATWAGLRPGSPDGRPLIGPVSLPGDVAESEARSAGNSPVWIAAGHYRNGVLLAPWTARLLAARMLDGAPASEAEERLFSVKRFASEAKPSADIPSAGALSSR